MSIEAQIQTLTATMQQTNALLTELLKRGSVVEAVTLETKPTQAAPTPAPAPQPESEPAAPEFDANGLPWDERIHASSMAKNADGTWRRRKNVSDEEYNAIVAQINPKQQSLPVEEPETAEDPTPAPSGDGGFAEASHTPAPETADTPESEPESSSGTSEFDAPPANAKPLTLDDIRRKSVEISKSKGADHVRNTMKTFGALQLPDLKQDDYAAYVAALEA